MWLFFSRSFVNAKAITRMPASDNELSNPNNALQLHPSTAYKPGLVLMDEEAELNRKLQLFGTDVGSIPCFRNSFLYGITGGIGSGIAHFAVSSRLPGATKFGFWSYVGITACFWCWCRYDYTMTKFRYSQLSYAMKQNALKDGTPESFRNELNESKGS
ncbi:Cytochrome c oxidase protein 20 [Orchesella cincta]|uniref:Cytochrome c oxidase assembly protein COX20, mitochondrial n=1 Tax=Orchesella cincta TaxID=48709 RepID=A0A1D2NLD7_ORCCI|nr:Cytochrome c oxidase protein 20 [Orchesella cincta]